MCVICGRKGGITSIFTGFLITAAVLEMIIDVNEFVCQLCG